MSADTSEPSDMTVEPRVPVYLMAAPIGEHVGDMSMTVMKLVRSLSLLLVEDTGPDECNSLVGTLKSSGVIGTGQTLIPIDNSPPDSSVLQAIDRCIEAGQPFGLLPDRGISCFVDPGAKVVQYLIDHHRDRIELVPVGASSALDAAIMMSGVDCTFFSFMGHFPEQYRWPVDSLCAGIPVVSYVRFDSAARFWQAARSTIGDPSGLRISFFRNIRGRRRRFQGNFPLDMDPATTGFPGFDPRDLEGTGSDNFVAMIHPPWFVEDSGRG